jgi:hypothetical protein
MIPMDVGLKTREPGDLLLEQGKLTEKQLEMVRRRQQRLNTPQHRAIVELNYASEENTYRALAQLHNLEFMDLSHWVPALSVFYQVPVKFIFHYWMVPFPPDREALTLASS